LYASALKAKDTRSVMAVFFETEKSKFATPADRIDGSTRGSLPNWKGPGCVKQEVLNHCAK
jgi:hypothetical protein